MSELHYQQSPPLRHRKLFRRSLLVLIVVIGVAAATPLLLREVERMRLIRLYDACCRTGRPVAADGDNTVLIPPEWRQLNAALGSNISSGGTIFLGKLSTPYGAREYLVGVDVVRRTRGWFSSDLQLRARTLNRGGRLGTPHYHQTSDSSLGLPPMRQHFNLRVGETDANDRSHFTIEYEIDQGGGLIDGWLKNDGRVVLEPRDSATTAPAPPSPATSQ